MNEIAFIVDTLNRPPFEKQLTIVDFAQKSPVELLQIVNDVFAFIDESQRRDIRAEQRTPDIMSALPGCVVPVLACSKPAGLVWRVAALARDVTRACVGNNVCFSSWLCSTTSTPWS